MRRRWFGGDDETLADDGVSTVFRDTFLNGAGALLAFVVVLLTLMNPPTEEVSELTVPPGNIIIEAYWPNELNADVDLWVKGPEGSPVGYSNKGGTHYNLLRDDLGKQSDDDPVNYEVTYSRGIPVGGHCVNLHLYSNRSNVLPIPVKVTVKLAQGEVGGNMKGSGSPVLITDVKLSATGKERNVFCFVTNKEGKIETGKDAVYQSDAICLRSPSGC